MYESKLKVLAIIVIVFVSIFVLIAVNELYQDMKAAPRLNAFPGDDQTGQPIDAGCPCWDSAHGVCLPQEACL